MPRPAWSKCLPIELWPRSDRLAWHAAMRPRGVFDPPGPAALWSEPTRRKTALGYGRFLFWLHQRGELESEDPAVRVTRGRVAAYLNELKRVNRGHTIHNRIQELGDAMRVLAPGSDWRWLLRAAGRLRAATIPANDKRSRLRPIDDLIAQGIRMMKEAKSETGLSELGRAARFRDGLMVAFLGFHPLRLRNLASLRVGHHLVREGTSFVLKLAATETKGGQAYEAVITRPLAEAINEYLMHQRPVLVNAKGRWHATAGHAFWISRDGSPCSEKTFANIVVKHVIGADGRSFSPHLFRSCSATSIATKAPHSIDLIPAVLGHSSPKTGERYYNMAKSLEASRTHGAMIEDLQQQILQR